MSSVYETWLGRVLTMWNIMPLWIESKSCRDEED